MLKLFIIFLFSTLSASTVVMAPIVVTLKKEKKSPKWQFIESLNAGNEASSGFEEQQLKNIPGVNTVTNGNPGQLTTISIQGAPSKYTKILWSGVGIFETETDASLIPFSTGTVEIVKGVHCAEYGNGSIGGIVNVIPFSMPEKQNGGVKLSAGNYSQCSHLWWRKKTNGFSLQQHIEGDTFRGKNSIPKRYQAKYPTDKSPQTQKQYFLNQLAYENNHARSALQFGFLKSGSTGSDIIYHPLPCDSRSKRSLQIYAFDIEGKQESVQPYMKILHARIRGQDFSPYQNIGFSNDTQNTKTKFGVRVKHNELVFEPLVEQHHNTYSSVGSSIKKNDEVAFAQGIHLIRTNITWKNWARIHKSNHFNCVYALSSSLLLTDGDTEFSAHIGSGFRLPDLNMLNEKKYGNSSLKQETAYGGNLGVAQKTKIGTLSIMLFKTEYKHQITFQNNKYINLNKANQQGFELGWKNQIGSWGTHVSSLYTESKSVRPKKTIMNIPRLTMLGKIFYEQDDVAASMGWRYTGNQIQPDFEDYSMGIKRGGYTVLFSDFKYKFTENAKWFTSVENALARYTENPPGYRSPGFQINTGISITW